MSENFEDEFYKSESFFISDSLASQISADALQLEEESNFLVSDTRENQSDISAHFMKPIKLDRDEGKVELKVGLPTAKRMMRDKTTTVVIWDLSIQIDTEHAIFEWDGAEMTIVAKIIQEHR